MSVANTDFIIDVWRKSPLLATAMFFAITFGGTGYSFISWAGDKIKSEAVEESKEFTIQKFSEATSQIDEVRNEVSQVSRDLSDLAKDQRQTACNQLQMHMYMLNRDKNNLEEDEVKEPTAHKRRSIKELKSEIELVSEKYKKCL